MDTKAIFGRVRIGKDTSGNFKLSFKGLAVRTEDGKFFAKDGDHMLDVSDLTLDGAEGYIYRLPVQSVKPGDLIITSENPFDVLFVQAVGEDGGLSGLDPRNNTVVDYVQPTNLFNVQFFVKVVSLVDVLGGNTANEQLLPFLLLANRSERGRTDDSLTTLLMLQALGGNPLDGNSLLLPLLLMDGKSDALEMFFLMQVLGGSKSPLADLFGQPPARSQPVTASTEYQKPRRKS